MRKVIGILQIVAGAALAAIGVLELLNKSRRVY